MNKADLVNLVAARTELTKTDVSLVVDAAIETIVDSVVEGKKVSILGFGSFEPRDRSARQGLNPKTGEKIAIPAKEFLHFQQENSLRIESKANNLTAKFVLNTGAHMSTFFYKEKGLIIFFYLFT